MTISKIAFLAVAALAFGCDENDADRDKDNDGIDDNIDEQIDEAGPGGTPGVLEWRATLVPTELYSTIGGDALVVKEENEVAFTASITVREDVPGSVRPWHVHVGRCGTGGVIVGEADAYPPLMVGNDGVAMTEVLIRVFIEPAGEYSVNVRYSEAKFSRIIACGDLVFQ